MLHFNLSAGNGRRRFIFVEKEGKRVARIDSKGDIFFSQKLNIREESLIFSVADCAKYGDIDQAIIRAHELIKSPAVTHTPTNPSHYKFTLDGKEYDIDQVIVALNLPWRLANAMKYIARAGKKDDENQDISKAITYLQRHIQ